uniref:Uncharacterized protein n=1 Tax=Poecilia mexicana TaxID=48701 RepID=A0A3B3XKV8_9TELE
MPVDQISVTDFVAETNEDYKAPTTSSFTTRMSHCRNTVGALEEVVSGEQCIICMWYNNRRNAVGSESVPHEMFHKIFRK